MGTVATILTIVGGTASGTGATIIAEGLTMSIGHQFCATKLGKACVDVFACAVGGAAFTKGYDMFTDQAIEFFQAVDKFKARKKSDEGVKDEEEA